jgi:hypothetical protein
VADPKWDRRRAKLAYRRVGSGTQKANPQSNDGDITMGDPVGDESEDEMLENSGDIGLIDKDEDALEDLMEQVQHQFNSLIVIVSDSSLRYTWLKNLPSRNRCSA